MGLSRTDGNRATLIPWSRGKPLAWNVTVPDTFLESHLKDTAVITGAATNQVATFKTTKHTFVPIAIETSGSWNNEAIKIMQEIGKQITSIASDLNETNYLFQRISIAIQRGMQCHF